MNQANILTACAEKKMRPVCNNVKYADGECIIVGGDWHFSLKENTKDRDLPPSLLRGTFTYCGAENNGWALLDTGTNHRWSRSTDKNGDTLCVAPDRQSKIFVSGKWQFVRVEVKDYMTGSNILKTCQNLRMRPVCESKEYSDDQCRHFGNYHLSYPEEVHKHEGEVKA